MSAARPPRKAVAGAVFLASVAVSAQASAYCRTAACGDNVGARCTPELGTDCGIALFWPTSCVGFSMQRDASSSVDLDTATSVVRDAFDVWQAADCGGGAHPSIQAVDLGPVDCSRQEYDGEAKNANIVIFRDGLWPYAEGALALTTVTFSVDTGEIRDADIELNSAHANFTTGDAGILVDLPSILTHETGHFLGLAHSPVSQATMQSEYAPKSTFLRSLEADDVAAICAVYPPDAPRACDSTPVNGLGDSCGEAAGGADGSGCGVAPHGLGARGAAPFGATAGLGVVGLAGLLVLAGTRARRPRP